MLPKIGTAIQAVGEVFLMTMRTSEILMFMINGVTSIVRDSIRYLLLTRSWEHSASPPIREYKYILGALFPGSRSD